MDISNLKDHKEGVEGKIRFVVGNPDLTASRIDLEYVYTERTIRVPRQLSFSNPFLSRHFQRWIFRGRVYV